MNELDATTMSLLYKIFSKKYPNVQFLSIHDCFGTTCDKVSVVKTILAFVYTDLYSNSPILLMLK
jgi:DNA-directed RNA polymerase